jgi:hypothetical protein
MKQIVLSLILLSSVILNANGQNNLSSKLLDGTQTPQKIDGNYGEAAIENGKLNVNNPSKPETLTAGLAPINQSAQASSLGLATQKTLVQTLKSTPRPSALQASSSSSWVGATLMQNLDGNGAEGLIGSGNVKLATAEDLTGPFKLNIVGNISNISKASNLESIKSDLIRIGQSTQGLSAGLEPQYIIVKDHKFVKLFDVYSHLLYKVNDFQKINGTDENVILSQFRASVGFEIEAIKFNGKDYMLLSVEGIRSGFDANRYSKIFGTPKSSVYSLEIVGVVPLVSRIGLLVMQNYTTSAPSVFSAGLVVKSQL